MRDQHTNASTAILTATLVASLLGTAFLGSALVGCASSGEKKSLFNWGKKNDVERLSTRKEDEIINRAALATAASFDSPWEPTDAEIQAARAAEKDADESSFSTAVQRPNGGVLFPKKLPAPGPVVVLEPTEIAAPIGTEVVLVAGFVGEDSEYLRVGEKLEWNLTGPGTFLATNPKNSLCGSWNTSKKINDRYLETETTSKLWRIHRGTSTELDDVTILRGQSWVTVESQEEGTSSVVVFSNNIDNWNNRKALGEIYWVDCSLQFPESLVEPVGTSPTVTTTVRRRSNGDPRSGWTVRYEVLSGDAGFGPQSAKTIDVLTDANGQASVSLTQKSGAAGPCKASATVLRPANESDKSVPVESRTFFCTWTTFSGPMVKLQSPGTTAVGEESIFTANLTNFSDFEQNVKLELLVPANARFVRSTPEPTTVSDPDANGRVRAVWDVNKLPARYTYPIEIVLKQTSAGRLSPTVRLISASASDATAAPSASTSSPSATSSTGTPANALGTTPPVEISPSTGTGSSNGAPNPLEELPPVESPTPTPDPASTQPSLGATFPSNVRVASAFPNETSVSIPNAASSTSETTAFRFEGIRSEGDSSTTPRAGVPFEARFALTNPNASSEPIIVKVVANPGVALLLDDSTGERRRLGEIAYPARRLDEIGNVVFKTRAVADASGPRSLLFLAYRPNGETLSGNVFAFDVADGDSGAARETSKAPESGVPNADARTTRTVARPQSSSEIANDANADGADGGVGINAGQGGSSGRRAAQFAATVVPKTLAGRPASVVVRTESGATVDPSGSATVGLPFVYRATLRNFGETTIEPNELEIAVELPPELTFGADAQTVLRLAKSLPPGGQFDFETPLKALKSGETTLAFDLRDAQTGETFVVAKLPLEVADAPSDADARR